MDLASIIQALSEQIRTLQDRVDFLEEENKALRQEIVGLRKENTKLRQENDRPIERLGLNSSNSSLPPSRAFIESKGITGLVVTGILGGDNLVIHTTAINRNLPTKWLIFSPKLVGIASLWKSTQIFGLSKK